MNERILIVEDEPGLRLTLGDRLRREGYDVETAADGDEGFRRASSEPFNLIVLDVMLPLRNGFDVCRDLRQARIQTPVLMLTARGGLDDQRPGLFETWHHDDTYTEDPAAATVLHARALPPSGGGPTCFLDARAAWDGTFGPERSEKVHVEAAAWQGKPVYFSVGGDWQGNEPADASPYGPWFTTALAVFYPCYFLGAAVLAWRPRPP